MASETRRVWSEGNKLKKETIYLNALKLRSKATRLLPSLQSLSQPAPVACASDWRDLDRSNYRFDTRNLFYLQTCNDTTSVPHAPSRCDVADCVAE